MTADHRKLVARGLGGAMGAVGGRAVLAAVAPDVAAGLDTLVATAPVPPDWLAIVRSSCGAALGLEPLPRPAGARSGRPAPDGAVEDVLAAFAVQFSVDVARVDDDHRARLHDRCGAEAFAAVQATWIADLAPRVRAVLDALFGTSTWPWDVVASTDAAESWARIEAFLAAVHRLDRLDPILSEAIRLHGARQHGCRLCMSLRSRPALAAGADETVLAGLDGPHPDALPRRARVALELVDALVWHPAAPGPDLVRAARSELAPEEIVEVVVDVMRNAANKIAVALAADDPHVEHGIEVYEVDADGTAHYGLAPP